MVEKNISQEFKLKNIEEIKNYFIKERDQNELMSNKHKKVFANLNYIEHALVFAFVVTGCVLIFVFPSLVCIPIGILSSALRIKICAITAVIKKYMSVIKKKKKKHDKIEKGKARKN